MSARILRTLLGAVCILGATACQALTSGLPVWPGIVPIVLAVWGTLLIGGPRHAH